MNRYVPISFSAIFLLMAFFPCQVWGASITQTKAAIGDGCTASGSHSTAMGYNTIASNDYATAMGYWSTAKGNLSTAMGYYATASGDYSTAIGNRTTASNNYSTAMGYYTTASGYVGTVVGRGFDYDNRLINNINSSFMVGYMANASDTAPELFVKDGGVGIGTTDPKRIMHIVGVNPRILIEGSTGNPEINFKKSGDASNAIWALYKDSNSNDFRFYQGANRMTIQNATGNVGIGTTSPGKKLYVEGSAGGTQAWNASDVREKTQIKPIQNALDSILELRGVSYRWEKGDEQESQGFDNKTHFGVIAQEVEAVYPELVDNPGITEKRKHVEYNGLVGVLIEAVKELKVRNEKQQAEIEELQSIIKELKS